MNKKIIAALLIIPLILVAGIFSLFFINMGTNDAKALAEFPVAYNNYDQAINDLSRVILTPNFASPADVDPLEHQADEALVILTARALVRISSLTIHDGELMQVAGEIASLAKQELDVLKSYRSSTAYPPVDLENIVRQIRELTSQRQVDYGRYQDLAAINK